MRIFKRIPVMVRFMRKVVLIPFSDCWFWEGGCDEKGYGLIGVGNPYKTTKAHRISYGLFVSGIPDGLHVLHKCDNRKCVNPKHLYLGTHQENMADMVAKGRGRGPCGEKSHLSKLTVEKVAEIRASFLEVKALAEQFSITTTTVRDIQTRKTWKHV